MFELLSIPFILLNLIFAMEILFFISLTHLPSDVMLLPRYSKQLSCFTSAPFTVILQLGVICFLLITSVFVFFLFIDNPTASLSSFRIETSFCSFASESAIRTVSSAYLKFVKLKPPMRTPSSFSKFQMIFSLYKENRSGDQTHPCRTPLLILIHSVNSFSTLMAAS